MSKRTNQKNTDRAKNSARSEAGQAKRNLCSGASRLRRGLITWDQYRERYERYAPIILAAGLDMPDVPFPP